ncbi:MAG TPA: hypothetical protein VHL30_02250 [Chlamydiales bacterium]|nr:hypothetical protein [Chlamydiales bacterium]
MILMKPKKRQKLCYNCEGEVDLDVIVCPFCAADLREEKPELARNSFSPSITSVKHLNGENSLYPYGRSIPPEESASEGMDEMRIADAEERDSGVDSLGGEQPAKSTLSALLLVALGVQLFLLGLLLVLFSDRGIVILKWDASLWFLYIFASIPFLLFGYRLLNKL